MDELILRSILKNQDKQKSVLATIVHTEGSTPREPGTQMLIMENGQTLGTVGGGSVEKHIYQRAQALMTVDSQVQVEIQHWKINDEPGHDEFPSCGGNLDVLLELIKEQDIWQLVYNLQINSKAVLITALFPTYQKSLVDLEGNFLGGSQTNFECSPQELQKLITSKRAEVLENNEKQRWLVEPILKKERLLILGAGHVAKEVAQYAKSLDFEITVIDDRIDFAKTKFFPGAYQVLCSDFVQGIQNYRPNDDTYVVIASWSHQTDADCVREVLKFEAKYVGMLGSTKKVATIVNKLNEENYLTQNIARLRAPIGLDIGAQTPSEIALSILAEIISVRRK
ncbi:XdhC family protein [Desulfitobacterium metallireducens]|uniref:Cytochrome oxidase I n=1 Tax=Desulfitobacterium metallireducens DSM 15288 TaxID=871968 RepID=W0EBM1_9FIRM|nr:XdhC/CoxI family protein [Desulfitobacterium metallireducens]AHF06604.1 cytochrome oxidase I [Desulfitobacterium metallireducens DSM 15288]